MIGWIVLIVSLLLETSCFIEFILIMFPQITFQSASMRCVQQNTLVNHSAIFENNLNELNETISELKPII
jgi:hypothetical protein